jgi:hypothetical protein
MLSNPRNNFSYFYGQVGCVFIMQMHGHIHNKVQMNSFEIFAIQVKEKAITFEFVRYFFKCYEQLGCVWIMQTWGRIQNDVKIFGF